MGSPGVVCLAVHVVFPDEAGGLTVEGQLAHAAPQTRLVPRSGVDPQQEAVGDHVPAPLTHLAAPLHETQVSGGQVSR